MKNMPGDNALKSKVGNCTFTFNHCKHKMVFKGNIKVRRATMESNNIRFEGKFHNLLIL